MLGGRAHLARVTTSAAVAMVIVASCGTDTGTIDASAAHGWPAVHGDSRNSNFTDTTDSSNVELDWTRPLGGAVVSPVSIASTGQMFVSTYTDAGCNLFSFEMDSGRKRWCNRIGPSVATATPLVDSVANIYVGDDGGFSSYNDHGQLRWRAPVYGVPRSAQFLGDGSVLAVTQLGQVNIFDTQTGQHAVPIHDLIEPPGFLEAPDTDFAPATTGLEECAVGSAACPVAAAPAVDLASSDVYLVLWREGAVAPQLISLHIDADATPAVTERWSSTLLPAAVDSSPVLSDDGATVYFADVDGRLNAYNTSDGSEKWTYGVGLGASATPSVSPDGTIVPAGGDGGMLALHDDGDHATLEWAREDLRQLGIPVQSTDGSIVTVTGDGENLALTTIDARSGDTVSDRTLPDATGFTVGTSIGPQGQIVTSTYLGEIFTYSAP